MDLNVTGQLQWPSGPGQATSPEAMPGVGQQEPPILEVQDLRIELHTRKRAPARVIDGVSFELAEGGSMALLGETGSGKSTLARAIMGTLRPGFKVSAGQVRFGGQDLQSLPATRRRELRGVQIGMVPQEALGALNPVLQVGEQIAEMLRVHASMPRGDARRTAVELMDRVGIADAHHRARAYPHEFSGGMRQRVLIAMAIALSPKLLIADEPTTALDVTTQAQIVDLLGELRRELHMTLLLITHDIALAGELTDQVVVLYSGRTVEVGNLQLVCGRSAHPYVAGLMASRLRVDGPRGELRPIPGSAPTIDQVPGGCAFHPRCAFAQPICRLEIPGGHEIGPGHISWCHFPESVAK